MGWKEERVAIEGKFTGWAWSAISWPNKPFNEPNSPYLAVTILDGEANEATFGLPILRRHVGLVSVQIFAPENTGEVAMRDLADKVEALFINAGSRTVISQTEYIDYAAPGLSAIQTLNGWAQRNLSVPFIRNEIK